MTITATEGLCPYLRTHTGGQPLVALHGLGGSSAQPLGLLSPAVLDRFDVIAPDLRAHGTNRLPIDDDLLSFQQLADDVEALLDALALDEPPVLLGISMGAGIALELQRRPTAFAHVVLIRPAWAWDPNPANLSAFPVIAGLLDQHSPHEARERFRDTEQYASIAATSPAAAQALLPQFEEPLAVDRRARLTRMPADAPTRPKVTAPITVVGTTRDPVHPLALAEQVASDLDARLQVIAPRYDDPEQHITDLAATLLAL